MKNGQKGIIQIDLDDLNAAISSAVAQLGNNGKARSRSKQPPSGPFASVNVPSNPQRAGQLARFYLRSRRYRERIFPIELFGEGAWDILLDLYAAKVERKLVSVSSACFASGVPPTTAMRHISKLLKMGLISREDDDRDRRKTWLFLNEEAAQQIEQWLLKTFTMAPTDRQ